MERFPVRPFVLFLCLLSTGPHLLAEEPDSTVTMLFAGDCLLAGHYERAAERNPGMAFDGFRAFHDADIAMVNLECPVTDRGEPQEKPYTFRMRPDYAPALAAAGIDIVNVANNHIYDFGDPGLFDTLDSLDSIGVAHVGAGRTADEAHRPVTIRVKNHRIGFLGYYGGGEAPKAGPNNAGVADRALAGIRKDIAALRDSVDYLVVNFHWGDELAPSPSPAQVRFAHATIDAGADAIIGHHPHVLQGIEHYHNGVIVYSLGNFVFGGNSRNSYQTALFRIELSAGIPSFGVIPIRVDHWRVSLSEGAEAEETLHLVRVRSQEFAGTIFNK